jgi:hypothetical protein
VLDSTASVLDPRVSLTAGARYTKDRFAVYLNVDSVLSLTPNDEGALSAVGALLGTSYDLGAGFAIDGGVRGAWQQFEGSDLIPPSYAVFIGLSWGAVVYRD